jgi:hydroxymethylbilane synthase
LIRLGTRGSALALAQARQVASLIGDEVEIVEITTSGDKGVGAGDDKSRFVKEIEEALLEGDVDLAVHSAKDVPGELPEGLAIAGVPERADPRDAICGAAAIADLAEGAVVGTSSLRRRSQLLALRPDLDVRDVRGNVDTRLGKLSAGDYDALVLARAGLVRLDRAEGEPVPEVEMTPAPGQGCLALEARADDDEMRRVAEELTHRESLVELTAERAVVTALEATCHTPVGARARLEGERLTVDAYAGLPDGSTWVRDTVEGGSADPAGLGRSLAERMLAAGARALLG